jgi:acyl-[acyl-carrier-protein]-phospholipid O-acyltransferase/long-chain-fatty-acid--[acyl-carrier-protein] ligase
MQDSIFNAMPVFHSFGLTGGLILPLVTGMRTFMYPSPVHYNVIPEVVYQTRSTAIFGTDVLLTGYARKGEPYHFSSVRYVVAGAEKVKPETRAVWMEKFGLRILEGYGITEGAPVVAVNTPFFFRSGTVGRFVPGIEHRLKAVPGVDEGGQLVIRGPNVMKGYLKADKPGVLQPLDGGWHDTGDIVAIDAEGFVSIKGRKKRFCKIGGEMVSLAAVETYVSAAWPDNGHVAVALPDPRKGERIVLMTTRQGLAKAEVQAAARLAGATELMVPSSIMYLEKLPLLGSGKVDFVEAQKIALASLNATDDSVSGTAAEKELETA